MNLSLADCAGSLVPALTARKLGMMPRMRLVCRPSESSSVCACDEGVPAGAACCAVALEACWAGDGNARADAAMTENKRVRAAGKVTTIACGCRLQAKGKISLMFHIDVPGRQNVRRKLSKCGYFLRIVTGDSWL